MPITSSGRDRMKYSKNCVCVVLLIGVMELMWYVGKRLIDRGGDVCVVGDGNSGKGKRE